MDKRATGALLLWGERLPIPRILRTVYPIRLPLKALRHADFSAGAEKRRRPVRGSFSPRGVRMDERVTGALLLWGERLPIPQDFARCISDASAAESLAAC